MAEAEGLEAPVATEATPAEGVKSDAEQPEQVSQSVQEAEPDGTDESGTAYNAEAPEAVARRKEYRRRKDLEDERDQLLIAKAQAEERARLLEERVKEQAAKPAEPTQRVFSKAELRSAVQAGQITQDQADEYEERVLIPARVQETLQAERLKEKQVEPITRANNDIQAYLALAPELRDRNSQAFTNVAQTYRYLVENYNLPDNEVTQALAIQHSMGPLDALKAKKEAATLTRRNTPQTGLETPANGAAPRTQAIDLSKAPDHMQRIWNRTNTSQADREIEFRHWRERQQRA